MRTRVSRLAIVAVLAAALAPAVILAAPGPKLHPSGFGEHSYSAWKADEGLPDSHGNKDQALYFQKMTSTFTFAAGVAVFKGFEGMQTSAVLPLEFWWRTDGHCGAGAPRFNVRVETAPNVSQTVFVGCQGMVPGATVAYEGRTYQQRTFAGPLPPGTVLSLAIVFDEGNDVGPGFVHLDNIRIGNHVWTSASDNANNEVIVQSATGVEFIESLLGESISVLFPQ
jgi:hypothetical protein